jgi:hypothetical protein
MTNFNDEYDVGYLDPMQNIAKFFVRLPHDFNFSSDTDFSVDLILPLNMHNGLLWDISMSVDSTNWSAFLFTMPNMIAGAIPTNDEMLVWPQQIVLATGTVQSYWYTYQYQSMSPKVFRMTGINSDGSILKNLYMRIISATAITTANIRLTLSKVS